jgi:hypothetical protein
MHCARPVPPRTTRTTVRFGSSLCPAVTSLAAAPAAAPVAEPASWSAGKLDPVVCARAPGTGRGRSGSAPRIMDSLSIRWSLVRFQPGEPFDSKGLFYESSGRQNPSIFPVCRRRSDKPRCGISILLIRAARHGSIICSDVDRRTHRGAAPESAGRRSDLLRSVSGIGLRLQVSPTASRIR